MGRTRICAYGNQEAVRSAGIGQFELVLRACAHGEQRESSAHASDRQIVSEMAVFWIPAHDGTVAQIELAGERKTCGAFDADHGAAGLDAGTAYQSASSPTSDLSVSATSVGDSCPERGVVRGYYIPMRHGYLYLKAVMDWFSRYVLA